MAVSESSFLDGWGLIAQFNDPQGISLKD
jgi:hypothetical protein